MTNSSSSAQSSPDLEIKRLPPHAASAEVDDGGQDNHPPESSESPLQQKVQKKKRWWNFQVKTFHEESQANWWFASTAIPLLAATIGPLANVLSLAALVTYWRMNLVDDQGNTVPELSGYPFKDPHWCYYLNIVSLVLGFVGNFFLLCNFTNRIRYIIALPMTIILWYLATAILIALTIAMQLHAPPHRPTQTYTQGFWYAVIAAVLYLICSMLLMVNMLGFFLGHYHDQFDLTDHQRTLILQTMLFFIWLAGGGAIFSRTEALLHDPTNSWAFVDGLYFCDVTILTVGFGDLYPHNDVGRGLVFPYSVGGIVMLGLVISSIHNFATELGQDKVIRNHVQHEMQRTMSRTVRSSSELSAREREFIPGARPSISEPFNPTRRNTITQIQIDEKPHPKHSLVHLPKHPLKRYRSKKSKMLVLREEKDRFDAMRQIQHATHTFKRWWRLTVSVIAFGILWNVGAVVFWQCEKGVQGMTYFQALYFCYVCLLTIGYGDLAPRSNAGRCFFVVWSLVAVPTMTILISDMGNTVISAFKRGTFALGDFTLLPKAGSWRQFLDKHPWLLRWLTMWTERRAAKKRLAQGFEVRDPDEEEGPLPEPDINELATQAAQDEEKPPSPKDLGRDLARAIKRTVIDMKQDHPRKYAYEEWVEFTRLIRFTAKNPDEVYEEEEEEGLVEWDWIGENSHMVAGLSEPEFVLDRLCESLSRLMRMVEPRQRRMSSQALSVHSSHCSSSVSSRVSGGAVNEDDDDEEVGPSGERREGSIGPECVLEEDPDIFHTPFTEEKHLDKDADGTRVEEGSKEDK